MLPKNCRWQGSGKLGNHGHPARVTAAWRYTQMVRIVEEVKGGSRGERAQGQKAATGVS